MSKKIQSLSVGRDEYRIIVSGSSTIGADGGSDGQARAASCGARPTRLLAPGLPLCDGSSEGSAKHRAARQRSGSSFASYERPSPIDHAMPVHGQAIWTSSCQTCIVSLRVRFLSNPNCHLLRKAGDNKLGSASLWLGKEPDIAAWCLQEVPWTADSKRTTTVFSQMHFLSLTASLDQGL